jgi:hypothetical protein
MIRSDKDRSLQAVLVKLRVVRIETSSAIVRIHFQNVETAVLYTGNSKLLLLYAADNSAAHVYKPHSGLHCTVLQSNIKVQK